MGEIRGVGHTTKIQLGWCPAVIRGARTRRRLRSCFFFFFSTTGSVSPLSVGARNGEIFPPLGEMGRRASCQVPGACRFLGPCP